MKKLQPLIIYGLAASIVLVAAGAYVIWRSTQSPLPKSLVASAGIGLWYPDPKASGFIIDQKSVKFNDTGTDKLVTFVAKKASAELTFTEQAVPEGFIDVPQAYDKLTEKLREYTKFDSVNGTVSLTRPEELKGGQTAVMKSHGTLLFVKPNWQLTENEWRNLMNNLRLQS